MADFATEHGTFTVVNGYFPQGESRDHPVKFPAKTRFYQDLQTYLEQHHSATQPLIVMGDVNISPTDRISALVKRIASAGYARVNVLSYRKNVNGWRVCKAGD